MVEHDAFESEKMTCFYDCALVLFFSCFLPVVTCEED